MGTKVQNGRLELNIPFYENSGDKLVQIKDENNLEYASNDLLSSCINHTDIISGLSLKSYLNNLIITNGYFYENDKLYMFDDSTHIEVLETEESNIGQYMNNVITYGNICGGLIGYNNAITNFTDSSWVDLPNKIKDTSKQWEIQLKFILTENVTCRILGKSSNDLLCGCVIGYDSATSNLKLWLSSGNGWDIASQIDSTSTININKWYWIKLIYNGSSYVLQISEDGIQYTECIIINSSTPIYHTTEWSIGRYNTYYLKGYVDLNECYMKSNNEIIWKGVKPINEYTVYYLYDSNSFIYSDIEPSEKYKFIGKFRINGNNITYKNPSMDLAESYEHGFIIDEKYGSIGYRIYSDGWKEQWGNNANPVFPIAFEEIPTIYTNGATNVSKIGMTIGAGYWNVCGY